MSAGKNFVNTIILGFALFACFLGAGNLVFAPVTGLMVGREWHLALFAFALSGVLLPVTAFAAVARAGGIDGLASEMGKPFFMLFTSIAVLCTSFFVAAPRAAETIHELSIMPIFGPIPQVLTSLIFFAAVLYLSLNPLAAIKIIGKYIAPGLLGILALVIANSILNPMDIPADTGIPRLFALRSGFMDGYRTMDLFAGLIFSGAIFAAFTAHQPDSRLMRAVIACGSTLVALLALLFINGGLIYLGATGSGVFDVSIGDGAVLAGIFGMPVVLAFVAVLACLSTAVGLTVGTSLFFSRVTKDKLPYKTCVAVVCAASVLTSVLGDDVTMRHALWLLTLIYPAAIVLAALNVLRCPLINRGTFLGGVYSALVVSFLNMMFLGGHITLRVDALPFFVHGLAWITPAIACAVLGTPIYYLISKKGAHTP